MARNARTWFTPPQRPTRRKSDIKDVPAAESDFGFEGTLI